MLCQLCNENHANINLMMKINNHKENIQLCYSCYQKEGRKIESLTGTALNHFSSNPLFEEFFPNQKGQSVPAERAEQNKSTGNTNAFLEQFGRNLTNLAKAGLIDPVIGRDDEIKRIIEVLNRRNKNNPVLIGEPGVGKTAVAEGLAAKIASSDVPGKLLNKEVYLLDVASLVASTGIRGQFEERMKKLISELQKSKNIILFIDEIHLLVGAGSAEGSMDAGNILKPALARGELQLIGATTLNEYRRIEKDPALERRFQPITVSEPALEKSIEILKGLQTKYEDFHLVQYSDEAIKACVNLSNRYIQDRFLPDKAIDLMDEAGSKMNLTIKAADVNQLQVKLKEMAALKEKALKEEDYETAASLRDEEAELEKLLENAGNVKRPLIEVSHIQELIESKTGIPVGKLQEDQQTKMKGLEESLKAKVIGQDEAVQKVAKAIRRARAGLKSKNRPIGNFLFAGPTGVGKTELTKTLAEELFGSKDSMIRLDMSEYMEKHSTSKLIGSPPGYVGHEEAGQLTEKIRRNPYSIILLDEIEKAHPDVQHIFLQIMEDGRLTDSQGRTVSFKDSVIIMTSNAGAGFKSIRVGFEKQTELKQEGILSSLSSYFKPEFLNRFDSIIEFTPLNKEHLIKIVDILIVELKQTLEEQNIELTVQEKVKEKIAEKGYHPEFGARPLRRVIQEELEDRITDLILDQPDAVKLRAEWNNDESVIIVRQTELPKEA